MYHPIRYEYRGKIYLSNDLNTPIKYNKCAEYWRRSNNHVFDLNLDDNKMIIPDYGGVSYLVDKDFILDIPDLKINDDRMISIKDGVYYSIDYTHHDFIQKNFKSTEQCRHISLLPKEKMNVIEFEKCLKSIKLPTLIIYPGFLIYDKEDLKKISDPLTRVAADLLYEMAHYADIDTFDSELANWYFYYIYNNNPKFADLYQKDDALSRLTAGAYWSYLEEDTNELKEVIEKLSLVVHGFQEQQDNII